MMLLCQRVRTRRHFKKIVSCLLAIAICAYLHAQKVTHSVPNGRLATNCEEYLTLLHDTTSSIIRSRSDFVRYVREHLVLRTVIANYTLKKMLQDLVISGSGQLSFSYEVLRRIYPFSYKEYLRLLLEGFGWEAPDRLPVAAWGRYCKDGKIEKRPDAVCFTCM